MRASSRRAQTRRQRIATAVVPATPAASDGVRPSIAHRTNATRRFAGSLAQAALQAGERLAREILASASPVGAIGSGTDSSATSFGVPK